LEEEDKTWEKERHVLPQLPVRFKVQQFLRYYTSVSSINLMCTDHIPEDFNHLMSNELTMSEKSPKYFIFLRNFLKEN
jgi:hypothetical protein